MIQTKSSNNLLHYFSRGIKLFSDRVMAALLLLLFSPILLVVAIVVRLRMGSPVVFTQTRPGKNGKIFTVFKFRTMTDDCDAQGKLLSDEERLIPLGQVLRKASLDELPQLWNVLRGDMSFVGPRPLLVRYLERYSPDQARRHDVRPGITGWAQVNGRNALTWDEKFKLDLWYVDNWSLWLDLKILLMTVGKVIKREGISQSADIVAMPEFMGNDK
ncbi:sugar transferase [Chamaesiphon minutus]|uniref:Glycosyl transferase possibly involved in lipopolysaccharide synthesis n=1 Tax=Chamaesiphon minutus (strain ATCC 27169 / PCC 6605) TaxID=1173020 RepID=K9UKF7_CHAP6|nr:glycosyl transferase possibly involved in lipopolysaccharide synthesis [Chamaesiphon minutus PCC 6605]